MRFGILIIKTSSSSKMKYTLAPFGLLIVTKLKKYTY